MAEHLLFVDGGHVAAENEAEYASIDPATGQPWTTVSAASIADVDRAVLAADRAFRESGWATMSYAARADVLDACAMAIFEAQETLAPAEVRDAGGTIRKANMADVTATAQTFQCYAQLLRETEPEREHTEEVPVPSRNVIRREPIGVIGAIVPFNFPLAAAAWKIAPALAAGNAIVLKPSPLTPVTALMLAEICTGAGVPRGIVNVVTGPDHTIGQALVNHPKVGKVAFTGSCDVGKAVMADCARSLKPVLLELGGKSPNIILEDANLEGAVAGALFGTFFHAGQVCESGTRILVHRSIHDEFVAALVEGAASIVVGDPMDFMTTMGPLASQSQLDRVERYVALGREAGATVAFGGRRPDVGDGYYYLPTIFTDVTNDMAIAQDEIFGPVVVVIEFDTDEEALSIANDSRFGLGAAVWSHDIERARGLANRIESGTVWINDYHLLNPRFPFGGYKQSGFGRELGPEGLLAYQQIKHIHVGEPGGLEDKHYTAMLLETF